MSTITDPTERLLVALERIADLLGNVRSELKHTRTLLDKCMGSSTPDQRYLRIIDTMRHSSSFE
jgi:hypothetical protein